jgi:N-acetylglucosamine kinase-like BadF-type ATPase
MLSFFRLSSPAGMLDVMYGAGFAKEAVAAFAAELAALARGGDAFSAALFARAGRELGAAARALGARAHVRTLRIAAVGSMWKSWPLMRDAFVAAAAAPGGAGLDAFELVELTESSALGAAARAAFSDGTPLPIADATTLLFKYP